MVQEMHVRRIVLQQQVPSAVQSPMAYMARLLLHAMSYLVRLPLGSAVICRIDNPHSTLYLTVQSRSA